MSLIFAQLTHALGLNDVCEALRLHSGPLAAVRGASGVREDLIRLTGPARKHYPIGLRRVVASVEVDRQPLQIIGQKGHLPRAERNAFNDAARPQPCCGAAPARRVASE